MSRRVLCAVAATASACGASSGPSAPCRPAVPAGPHQEAGPLAVSADRGRVVRGTTVTFVTVVTGPARLTVPCDGPVEVTVADASADLAVFDGKAAPGAPGQCGPLSLTPGQRITYSVPWRPDDTLPLGGYTATVLVGDQPGLTLPVTVIGTADPARCS